MAMQAKFKMWGVIFFLLIGSATALAQSPSSVIPVEVQEVAVTDFFDAVEALGTLRANEAVEITATLTEVISEILFEDGQKVEAGDVLARLNSYEEMAAYEEAKYILEEAKSQYERVQPLAATGAVSESLLEERRRGYRTAEARLAGIDSRLKDRVILAPFSGVVGLRNVSPGTLVRPGDVITTLDDNRLMKLDFAVPELFLPVLKPGLKVLARSRAFEGQIFEGEVVSVDSRIDPVSRSIVARALIPNEDQLLKPGLLMTVELQKKPRRTVVIDEQALLPQGETNTVFLVVTREGKLVVESRPVRIGSRRPGEVEILEGLVAGDVIVTRGTMSVRSGSEVVVKEGFSVSKGPQS